MNGLENINHLMATPKKRKLQLFPPIELNNKANILSRGILGSSVNTFDVQKIDNEPQTPPNVNLLSAEQILAPVRSRRRLIGSPKPKAKPQSSLLASSEFSIPVPNLSKSLPTIIFDRTDDGNPEFQSSTLNFNRSTTPIPKTGRQRLLPINKLNSEVKETDWRSANKEINESDSKDLHQMLLRSKRRGSINRNRLSNKPVLDDIKTPHPFAPD